MDAVMKIKKIIKQFYPESTSSVIKDMDAAVLYSVTHLLILENNIHHAGYPHFRNLERQWQKLRLAYQLF